ncbi:hypothetical protein HG531_004994 [Fusarium graminearum]|nr:hypothetical protein HG531_004994 [Fusarium graminearum]
MSVKAGLHFLSLVVRHGKSSVDLLSNAAEIPWVDVNGVAQTTSSTTELGENERSVADFLADDVLQTRGVHAVTNRGNKSHVTSSEKGEATVHAVDAHNELVDAGRNLGVVLQILLLCLDASGVHFKEALKRLQLLSNTSNTIETITSDDDLLAAVELSQGIALFSHSIGPGKVLNLGGINTNWEDTNLDTCSIGIDPKSVRWKTENSGTAAQEVARIAHARKQHEEVIVDDHDVAGLVNLDDFVGELLVHAVVIGPLNALTSAVGRLMLLVVKKCVKIMLGISSPAGLVLEKDAFGGSLRLIGEPNWVGSDSLVVRQSVLETVLVLARNPETINGGRSRQACVTINGNRCGECVERSGT